MDENRERIRRARRSSQVKRMPYRTAVVGPVIDQVVQHFFPRQRSPLAVDKGEVDLLGPLVALKAVCIVLQPAVRSRQPSRQLAQLRKLRRVGGVMRLGAGAKPCTKQLFHPNHVIQLLPRKIKVRGASLAIDLANSGQRSAIRPGFVPQELVQKHSSGG